jgi:hypothetical protein
MASSSSVGPLADIEREACQDLLDVARNWAERLPFDSELRAVLVRTQFRLAAALGHSALELIRTARED